MFQRFICVVGIGLAAVAAMSGAEKDGMAELFLKKANLLQGKYFLDFAIESEDGQTADYYKGAASVDVFSVVEDVGVMRIDHEWTVG